MLATALFDSTTQAAPEDLVDSVIPMPYNLSCINTSEIFDPMLRDPVLLGKLAKPRVERHLFDPLESLQIADKEIRALVCRIPPEAINNIWKLLSAATE